MKRVFLDANVLLEVLLGRSLAEECIKALQDSDQQYIISALTIHIVWYIAEKYKLEPAKVDDLLSPWEVLSVTDATISTARKRYKGKDFEDCLQATCAEEGTCDAIMTLDQNFQKYSGARLEVTVISTKA